MNMVWSMSTGFRWSATRVGSNAMWLTWTATFCSMTMVIGPYTEPNTLVEKFLNVACWSFYGLAELVSWRTFGPAEVLNASSSTVRSLAREVHCEVPTNTASSQHIIAEVKLP